MTSLKQCVLALVLIPAVAGPTAADFPESFKASYSLFSRGARIASMQRVLSRGHDGDFVFRSETRAAGLIALLRRDHIVEQSTWIFADGFFRPLQYLYERSGGGRQRSVSVRFDWDLHRIVNTINGESWRMPAEPNVMDKLLYQFAVMVDLQSGRTPLTYTVADGGKIKVYNFERLGAETIKTPLGQLDTIKLSRHKQDSQQQTTLWCAPELHYLPVRVETVETDGAETLTVIESVSGLMN